MDHGYFQEKLTFFFKGKTKGPRTCDSRSILGIKISIDLFGRTDIRPITRQRNIIIPHRIDKTGPDRTFE